MKKTIIVLGFLASSCLYQNNLDEESSRLNENVPPSTNNQVLQPQEKQDKDNCSYVEEKSIEIDGKIYTFQFLISCNSNYLDKGRPPENNFSQEGLLINQQ